MKRPARREGGLVLAAVLFFILLMATAVATFLNRATVDGLIARNRSRLRSPRCSQKPKASIASAIARVKFAKPKWKGKLNANGKANSAVGGRR